MCARKVEPCTPLCRVNDNQRLAGPLESTEAQKKRFPSDLSHHSLKGCKCGVEIIVSQSTSVLSVSPHGTSSRDFRG